METSLECNFEKHNNTPPYSAHLLSRQATILSTYRTALLAIQYGARYDLTYYISIIVVQPHCITCSAIQICAHILCTYLYCTTCDTICAHIVSHVMWYKYVHNICVQYSAAYILSAHYIEEDTLYIRFPLSI